MCKFLFHTSLCIQFCLLYLLHNEKDRGRMYDFIAFLLLFVQFENLVTLRGNIAYWLSGQGLETDCLALSPVLPFTNYVTLFSLFCQHPHL